jgi:regulator of protease activity HflC (stomatin/prohibitin superfamily)
MLWRVDAEAEDGPLNFFLEYRTVEGTSPSLPGQFRTAFTGVLSGYELADLLGENSRLAEAETEIRDAMSASLVARGIRPEAVGISQMILPANVSRAVVQRMQAERNTLAETERTKGNVMAANIRADANTKAEKIRAFALQRAEDIRSRGQEQAAQYLSQMSEDPDLAVFLVWLDALEASLSDYTTVILPTYAAPFHLLNPNAATFRRSVPMPADGEYAAGDEESDVDEGELIAEQGP